MNKILILFSFYKLIQQHTGVWLAERIRTRTPVCQSSGLPSQNRIQTPFLKLSLFVLCQDPATPRREISLWEVACFSSVGIGLVLTKLTSSEWARKKTTLLPLWTQAGLTRPGSGQWNVSTFQAWPESILQALHTSSVSTEVLYVRWQPHRLEEAGCLSHLSEKDVQPAPDCHRSRDKPRLVSH